MRAWWKLYLVLVVAALGTRAAAQAVEFDVVSVKVIASDDRRDFSLDIGGTHAGSMVGLMNTSSQIGGLLSSVAYGYIVQGFGSYDAPFVPMAALLFAGTLLWCRIDASNTLTAVPTRAQSSDGSPVIGVDASNMPAD